MGVGDRRNARPPFVGVFDKLRLTLLRVTR